MHIIACYKSIYEQEWNLSSLIYLKQTTHTPASTMFLKKKKSSGKLYKKHQNLIGVILHAPLATIVNTHTHTHTEELQIEIGICVRSTRICRIGSPLYVLYAAIERFRAHFAKLQIFSNSHASATRNANNFARWATVLAKNCGTAC